MIMSVIYERRGLRLDRADTPDATGATRRSTAACHSITVPLTRNGELLLVTCRLPAASWSALAHRSRCSIIAVDPPRRLVASGDTCANGQLGFGAPMTSFLLL